MSRSETLVSSVENFLDVHTAWQADENQSVITEEYQTAIEDLLFTFAEGDMPSDLREVDRAVDGLRREWDRFSEYVSQSNPNPDRQFWGAVEQLERIHQGVIAPPQKPLESIKQLMEQKVSPTQIAIIYSHNGAGPFMHRGVPQPHKVIEEYSNPGSVLPAGFVHPAHAAKQKAAQEAKDRWVSRQKAKASAAPKAGPETFAELFAQGVTVEQIALIKCCSESEVLAEAKKLGVTPKTLEAIGRGPFDPEMSESDHHFLKGYTTAAEAVTDDPADVDDESGEDIEEDADEEIQPEPLSDEELRQEIIERSEAGENSATIASELGITVQKAAAVVASYRRQMSASGEQNG